MSGYVRKRRQVEVVFGPEDGDLAGLEITTRGLSLGTYLDITGMGTEDRSSLAEVLREMARSLTSWNLQEEDGSPVPATEEAVYGEDHHMMLAVARRWLDALAGVHKGDPLEESLPGGEPSPEASIPVVPLSESPQLSPAPS